MSIHYEYKPGMTIRTEFIGEDNLPMRLKLIRETEERCPPSGKLLWLCEESDGAQCKWSSGWFVPPSALEQLAKVAE